MTDNRTTELLPCPFCGGEADLRRDGWVLEVSTNSAPPWPDAVTVVRSGTSESMDYVPERTCTTVHMDCFGNPPWNNSGLHGNSTACGCSECGAPWSTCGLFRGNQLKHNFKACPVCGAKVVD